MLWRLVSLQLFCWRKFAVGSIRSWDCLHGWQKWCVMNPSVRDSSWLTETQLLGELLFGSCFCFEFLSSSRVAWSLLRTYNQHILGPLLWVTIWELYESGQESIGVQKLSVPIDSASEVVWLVDSQQKEVRLCPWWCLLAVLAIPLWRNLQYSPPLFHCR
jgi:hypothetical protein